MKIDDKLVKNITLIVFPLNLLNRMGGTVAQSVECATPGEEVPGLIPAVAPCSLMVGSVSVTCDQLRQKPWSPSSV